MAHRLRETGNHPDDPFAEARDVLAMAGDAMRALPTGHAVRADLHCHSEASNETGEAALNMIGCPESYSKPADVYAQALRRGMDFVTITDHDSIAGVETVRHLPGVLVGEELTCWFPEDGCKMHVLVYGLTRQQHDDLQRLATNLYDVADYFVEHGLAHSVAHPIYRQNDKLERWHVERLLLLFKSFECLNGAHSGLHREAFEPLLDSLDEAEIRRLSRVHELEPRWPEPWKKGRTAGSDDHGLLNIGRTWTEFPADVASVDDVLEAIRQGRTRPGGEAGTSAKLAHTFWGVAIRYYTRTMLEANGNTANLPATLMQALVGERTRPGKLQLVLLAARGKVRKLRRNVAARFKPGEPPQVKTSGLIKDLFVESVKKRLPQHPQLVAELDRGLPPLGNHDAMLRFVHDVNRDVSQGIVRAFEGSVDRASYVGIFDAIGAALAQQFVLAPHYFALFHQNKERRLLPSLTRQDVRRRGDRLKVALFTDTFDDVNGVARFIRDMGRLARDSGRELSVVTSVPKEDVRHGRDEAPFRHNFEPLVSRPMPMYEGLKVNIPPPLEILAWADREQFDAIHVSTPGPVGLLGLAAAKMLRVPVLATYHTDFPAYVEKITGDHRQAGNAAHFMRWFYGQPATVFSRSAAYRFKLGDLGVPETNVRQIRPGIDLSKFSPDQRDVEALRHAGVDPQRTPRVVLYAGRVSVEKNLPLLAAAFRQLCGRRDDVCLVVAGDGPYRERMQALLRGLPAFFPGYLDDCQLPALYATSDLFAFPSRTDTLGQVVMEAQACGLPCLVSPEGGPKETVEDKVTGLVLPATDERHAATWADAMHRLLGDQPRLDCMRSASLARAGRFSIRQSFDAWWGQHVEVANPPRPDDPHLPAPLPVGAA
jgi:glycosyltransferase involved in cell wall biosynthesis/predicted metal-dependent phosphoesterase TrpH